MARRVLFGTEVGAVAPAFVSATGEPVGDDYGEPTAQLSNWLRVTVSVGVVAAGSVPGTYVATFPAPELYGPHTITWFRESGTNPSVQVTEQLEVVSGHYATDAELRTAHPALADRDRFPVAVLAAARDEFADLAEQYLGTAHVLRGGVTGAGLPMRFAERWVIPIAGIPYVSTQAVLLLNRLADGSAEPELITDSRTVASAAGAYLDISADYSGGEIYSVLANYVYGTTTMPETLRRACREYVRATVLRDQSGVPRDVLSMSFGDGTSTRYSTPDWNAGRPTGYLEVDRLLNSVQREYRPGLA